MEADKKALIVTSIVGFIWLFLKNDICLLQELGYEVHCATNTKLTKNPNIVNELTELGIKVHDMPFSRSPFSQSNITAYQNLSKLMSLSRFDVVHCHTPVGGVLGRLAAHKSNIKYVLYTAHGFHFYKGAPLKNWLVYYTVEWLCSFWTDTLITINSEDFLRAKMHLHANRTEYVPGVGINLNKLRITGIDRAKKRKEIGVPEDCTLLLSVGELNKNKNHETVIRAIAGMDVYYIIAGSGNQREHLRTVACEVGMSNKVILLDHRADVGELYECSDVFVFPSFREGLSVSLMEAMAMCMPVVCSNIRGNVDLIDDHGGFLFNPTSIDDCKFAIERVLVSNAKALGAHNNMKVKAFSSEIVLEKMNRLYDRKSAQ